MILTNFPWTITYKKSDGESLRSVASLWSAPRMREGRLWETDFNENLGSHDFHDFLRFEIRFKKDFSLSAALPRNV